MKIKKTVSSLLIFAIFICILAINAIPAFAHDTMLSVQYDDCVANDGNSSNEDIDGINEMWYALSNNIVCYHISNDENTIKFAFTDNPETGDSWNDVAEADEIQEAYANSMKKWNNIYF